MQLVVLLQQLHKPGGKVLDQLSGPLENNHIPDHHQHLIKDGQSLGLQQLFLPVDIARLQQHHLACIALLNVNALKKGTLPELYVLPQLVLLEKMHDVYLVRRLFGVLAGGGDVVGHQQNHQLLQHETVPVVVALNRHRVTAEMKAQSTQ